MTTTTRYWAAGFSSRVVMPCHYCMPLLTG